MKRFNKLLCLAVCFMLTIAALGGCGSSNDAQNTSSSQSSASEAALTEPDLSVQTDYTKEILELSLWDSALDTMSTVQNDIISDEITKRTGVKWSSLEGNNGVDATQRFNLMVQSDSVPDVFWVSNQVTNIWSKCKENDLTWSLTMDDFIKYAPEIAKRLDPSVVAASILPDDTLYGIPSWVPLSEYDKGQNPDFAAATNDWQSWKGDYDVAYVRDDILKQIFPKANSFAQLNDIIAKTGTLTKEDVVINGLQTTEELISFLARVKSLNLRQDGKTVLPFGADGGFFTGAMGNNGGIYTNIWGIDYFNNNTGTYDLFYEKPEFKSLLKAWNAAAREDLIDPNYIVMKTEQKIEKMKRGEYAFISTALLNGKDLNTACEAFNRPYKYRPVLLPYKLTANFPGYWGCASNVAAFYLLNKKTIKEEDIPKILNFFNYYLTPEGADLVSWGPESAGLWEKDSSGKKKFKTQELQDSAVYYNYQPGAKDTLYYGLVDGGPSTAFDVRHYVFYMAQNNLAIPRLQNWPLPPSGTEDDIYSQAYSIDRHTQQWQIDSIWQGTVNRPDIDNALQKFSPSRDKVLNTILPKIIFSKDDSEFEKYYQTGLDTFYKEGDFATFKAAMEKGSKEFLSKNPELKPLEWPVK